MFEFSMYFLSFLPVWISVIIIDVFGLIQNEGNFWVECISIMVISIGTAICSIIVWEYLHKKGNQNREKYIIKSAKEERFLTAEFLVAYVLPLFAFDFTKLKGVVLFLVFFVIFWFLVYRHKYFCTNLLLEILKYRIYNCELGIGEHTIKKFVVSKNGLDARVGMEIKTMKFNNDYHFEVGIIDETAMVDGDKTD